MKASRVIHKEEAETTIFNLDQEAKPAVDGLNHFDWMFLPESRMTHLWMLSDREYRVGFATCTPDDVGVFRSCQIVKSHASFLSRLVRLLVLPVSHDRYIPDSGKFDGALIIRRADCVLCSIISVISSTPSAPGAVTARKCMRRAKGIEEMIKFRSILP
jgi:hypothetical protein